MGYAVFLKKRKLTSKELSGGSRESTIKSSALLSMTAPLIVRNLSWFASDFALGNSMRKKSRRPLSPDLTHYCKILVQRSKSRSPCFIQTSVCSLLYRLQQSRLVYQLRPSCSDFPIQPNGCMGFFITDL